MRPSARLPGGLYSASPHFAGRERSSELVDYPGCFAWYELLTTDVSAANSFYRSVLGWAAQDASTPDLPYLLFTAGTVPICGLMELPEEGRKLGARPRWMGYIGVDDVQLTAERIKRLGGAVYVPPTNTNIGLISVVADPQMVTFALVNGLKVGRKQPAEAGKPGHVGWHELIAEDWAKAFAFYSAIFDWQKDSELGEEEFYQLFSASGLTIGAIFTREPSDPPPFWLLYFNVEDIDAAAERVIEGGGEVFRAPQELLISGISVVRCADPQGAAFALRGKRGQISKLGWSAEWSGFSSRGRLVTPKPRRPIPNSES
jgi:predicted enzyme related to lactoylglutathione lyase